VLIAGRIETQQQHKNKSFLARGLDMGYCPTRSPRKYDDKKVSYTYYTLNSHNYDSKPNNWTLCHLFIFFIYLF
jgi:hypothetical protein